MPVSLSDAQTTWSPGTAPVTIRNRYFKWRPRDFNSLAIPRGSATVQQADATTAAINALGASGEVAEYESGTYFCTGTISPNGRNFSTTLEGRQVHFNNTTFATRSGTAANDFGIVTSQDSTKLIQNQDDPNDNLPAGENVRVFFDVTNCLYYNYNGKVNFVNNGVDRLAAIATSPTGGGQGPQGSCWDTIIINGFKYGVFGTPLYGDARDRYSGVFVGNQIKRLRTYNCTYHILFGGNTCDDAFIGQFNPIFFGGETALIYGAALCCGTIYTNGVTSGTPPIGLDIQDTNLHVNTFYAEEQLEVPLVVRKNSFVTINGAKHGAGANTEMTKHTFAYFPDQSGSGVIIAHQRTGEAASDNIAPAKDPTSLVLLKALPSGTSDKRNVTVYQNYPDSDLPPFGVEANGTGTLNTEGVFTAHIPGGNYGYKFSGTRQSPSLTRSNIYVP